MVNEVWKWVPHSLVKGSHQKILDKSIENVAKIIEKVGNVSALDVTGYRIALELDVVYLNDDIILFLIFIVLLDRAAIASNVEVPDLHRRSSHFWDKLGVGGDIVAKLKVKIDLVKTNVYLGAFLLDFEINVAFVVGGARQVESFCSCINNHVQGRNGYEVGVGLERGVLHGLDEGIHEENFVVVKEFSADWNDVATLRYWLGSGSVKKEGQDLEQVSHI